MRMRDEIVDYQGVAEEERDETVSFYPPKKGAVVVVVGYALTSKKIKSFLQPKFQDLARKKGIVFVAIDQSRPLSEQGPFDIVLHKLSGKEWRKVLENSCSFLS